MMWNEKLKKIDSLNTPKAFTQKWSGDISSVKLISDGINLVYFFEREGQGYFLRISHADLRSKQEILAAIAFQNHLVNHKVQVCLPVKSIQNEWVESINQQGETFVAHVCQEVPGNEMHYDLNKPAIYFQWGHR